MQTLMLLCLMVLGIASMGCAGKDVGFQHQPTPSPSPQSTSPLEASGGFARPEVGDTSTSVFEGTAGITEKKKPGIEPATLKEVRTGRHSNFDRVVLEFNGNEVPGYHIEYIDKPVRSCGSGDVVPLKGDAWLLIQTLPANAHDEDGQPTVSERERVLNLPVMKEMKLICDFEADVQWAVGLSKPNKYRVLELSNPARLVVDVNH